MNNHVKGIEYGEKALKIAQELNDKVEIVSSLNSLGIAYSKISDYPKSLDYFQKALAANENLENSDYILSLYTNISIIYYNLQDYNKALDYDNKAIKLAEQIGNKQVIAKLFFNKSSRFSALNQYEQALELDKKGLYYAEELNDSSYMLVGLSHLIHDYSVLKNYSQALYYGKRALELSTKFVEHETSSAIFGDLGDIYLNASEDILKSFGINPSDRYSKVEEAYQDAIIAAHKINDKVSLQSALKSASSFYEKKGNYIKAYELFKEHITIKDSISGDDVKKQITRKEIQYEFDKKEAALKYEQQLTANELEKQRLLTFQQGQTLTLKEQALALSNKEKDLAHLAFLKEKAEKQEKEQALLLAQKDKDLTGVQLLNLAKEKALQLQEIARKNATIGFLGASMLAILLAAALFYLWLKKRQAQTEATRQAELQAAFTQQLFAETESERARIARDLHDGISHELLGLKRTSLPANSDAAQKIDGVIESIRQISRNLHPVMLDSIGLQLSIESFCEQFAEAHNLFVNYEINYSNELHKNTELQVLRIIQEALTNTAKHANAQAANVSLSNYGNGVLLKIQDNGKGFEVEKALNSGKAFGLQSIIERAKIIHTKANIYSTPQGTIIELKIS
jgi:signal transduction histidine kinase